MGFLSSCSENSSSDNTLKEYIADDNTFQSWMNFALYTTKQSPDPALGKAHGGNDNTVTREIYFKDNQSRVNGIYPIGTVIVKHSKNPDNSFNMITAMVKRGNNFNPNAGDWEWFILGPNGKIMKDDNGVAMRGANLMDGMCAGCHSQAVSKDFVFSKNNL